MILGSSQILKFRRRLRQPVNQSGPVWFQPQWFFALLVHPNAALHDAWATKNSTQVWLKMHDVNKKNFYFLSTNVRRHISGPRPNDLNSQTEHANICDADFFLFGSRGLMAVTN